MPDLVEEQVIDIKDSFLKNGFKEGIQTAIDSAINLGKSALGIVTGNFENINQMQTAVKNGGIIDSVSNVLNSVINKVVDNGVISNSIGNVIKNGKNALLNNTLAVLSEFELTFGIKDAKSSIIQLNVFGDNIYTIKNTITKINTENNTYFRICFISFLSLSIIIEII